MKERDSFTIAPGQHGERLDKLIAERHQKLGRKRVADLFSEGAVSVAGRVAKKGDLARAGDVVELSITSDAGLVPEPDLPLEVRWLTDSVIVVNKPAGIPSIPLRASETGTLANALCGRFPELSGVGRGAHDAGLLHRLDTHTSGLLIAARDRTAFSHLKEALEQGLIEKRYAAIVESEGLAESGEIVRCLRPHPKNRRKVEALDAGRTVHGARSTVSRFRVLERHGRWALVEVSAARAYRHQVRAHFAAIGHPLAGDSLYGGVSVPELYPGRHALHACYVAWSGNAVVPSFEVSEKLPRDFRRILSARVDGRESS